MKTNYFLIILLIIAFNSFGQKSTEYAKVPASADTLGPCSPGVVFLVVDKKPEYKGGLSALESEINAVYKPDINIDGTVYVQFIINCKGYVSSVQVKRGLNTEIDSTLVKELMRLQNWQPGYKQVAENYNMRLSLRIKSGKITIVETE